VATLHRLGYAVDWSGAPLTDGEQLVELAPQDLIVSHSCGTYLTRLAQFVDDELVRLYGVEPYYRAERPEDLIGHLVVALAPHTSGGVAGRLLGFTDAEACFAHPVFHAAKRRNCDGDEDSVTLLMDALLNFSRSYLPESRGALMDKPLVLTTRLEATEVDKEAHNVDVSSRYPLALYRAAAERRDPKEVESMLDLVGHRLNTSRALSGYGFTHDTHRIAGGPVRSAYREGRPMVELVERSLILAAQIRAVDLAEAVTLVLNAHFLPDVMGNLKSYGTQRFRCKSCEVSYRRPPLSGRCVAERAGNRCDGELLSTVYEASVRKYLPLSSVSERWTGSRRTSGKGSSCWPTRSRRSFPGPPPRPRLTGSGRAPRRDPWGNREGSDFTTRPPRRAASPERPNSRRSVEGRRACGVVWTILLAFEASDVGSKSRGSSATKLPPSPSPAPVAD